MKKVDLLENESAKQTNKQTQPAIPYKYYIYIYGSNLGSHNRIEHYWQLYFEATVDPFRTVRPQELCFPSSMGPC